MKIVLIHGLAAKPEKLILKRTCESILNRDINLVYWADLMDYEPIEDSNLSKPYNLLEKTILPVRGILRNIVKEAVEKRLDGSKCSIFHDWLLRQTNKLSLEIYERFLPDLDKYFNLGYRAIVKERLKEQLPCDILIAHSMGSMIAADVLAEGDFKINKLITIGSPLGIRFIQKQLDLSYSRKQTLINSIKQSWLNFYDPLDIVALDNDLKDEFPGTIDYKIWNDQISPNGSRWHHSLYGYLKVVKNFL
jgi:hypothetical protein